MARRCGCASETCSCVISPDGGEGIIVSGTGSPTNPYVINSTLTEIETGIDVEVNNTNVALDVHTIDFRGSGVTVSPGADEVVVTIPGGSGGSGTTVPAGTVWMYGGSVAPSGWLMCSGGTQLISAFPDLFAALSTRFGGDGITTFGIPDMRDRAPVGSSPAKIVGAQGGAATKTIGLANLPPHTHTINHDHAAFNSGAGGAHNHSTARRDSVGNANDAVANGGGVATSRLNTDSESSHVHNINVPAFSGTSGTGTGLTGTALDVMNPWLAMAFIIKT